MIGRLDELRELEERYNNNNFEFGIVYGTRRIGKTTILDHFSKLHNGLMFQALKATFKENMSSLSRKIREYLGFDDNLVYESFQDAMKDLLKQKSSEKLLFIIDEFSYLCEGSKSLISLFQDYVDHEFKEAKIMLVLSGSNISFMKELMEDKTNPLYKRQTFEMNIKKMRFSESLGFLTNTSIDDKIKYLALFDTHPFYLSMIDANKSFNDNIQKMFFSKFSILLEAPNLVLPQGTTNNMIYNSIIYQISRGKKTPKELSDVLRYDSNYLSPYLKNLCEMEILNKNEMLNGSKKNIEYDLVDNFIKFYYLFIANHIDIINLGGGIIYYKSIAEQIDLYISKAFEHVVIDYMNELNINGQLKHLYGIINNYRIDNSKIGRSIEFDGITEGIGKDKNKLLVIECKLKNKMVSIETLEHLKESTTIFDKYDEIDYYLFSKNGFTESLKEIKDNHIHLIKIDEMFKNY